MGLILLLATSCVGDGAGIDRCAGWRPIEGQQITPEQPLFLGLVALDSNGVLYRSTRAGDDLKPRLQLTYQ